MQHSTTLKNKLRFIRKDIFAFARVSFLFMKQKDRTRSIECAGVVYLGRDVLSPSSLTKRALQSFLSRMKQ
ncbi:hypothetical protein D8Z77_04750 [Brevibacillus laterosporus]|nr:hypothetical protein D8Z77_04750 [Brevibacillus laterosporus]